MRLLLLEVKVLPVFVAVDDDGPPTKYADQEPTTITAADWPAFPAQLEELRAQTEANLSEAAARRAEQEIVAAAEQEAREAQEAKDAAEREREAERVAKSNGADKDKAKAR